jgi:hypothetical protein
MNEKERPCRANRETNEFEIMFGRVYGEFES